MDVLRNNGAVCGVVLEDGTRIHSKIVIDAEESQGLVAIRAGVRKKYPPEAISLSDAYDYAGRETLAGNSGNRPVVGEAVFKILVEGMDLLLRLLSPLVKLLAVIGFHLSGLSNPVMKLLLPVIRPIYKLLRKPLSPVGNWLADRLVNFVERADPALFEVSERARTRTEAAAQKEALKP